MNKVCTFVKSPVNVSVQSVYYLILWIFIWFFDTHKAGYAPHSCIAPNAASVLLNKEHKVVIHVCGRQDSQSLLNLHMAAR